MQKIYSEKQVVASSVIMYAENYGIETISLLLKDSIDLNSPQAKNLIENRSNELYSLILDAPELKNKMAELNLVLDEKQVLYEEHAVFLINGPFQLGLEIAKEVQLDDSDLLSKSLKLKHKFYSKNNPGYIAIRNFCHSMTKKFPHHPAIFEPKDMIPTFVGLTGFNKNVSSESTINPETLSQNIPSENITNSSSLVSDNSLEPVHPTKHLFQYYETSYTATPQQRIQHYKNSIKTRTNYFLPSNMLKRISTFTIEVNSFYSLAEFCKLFGIEEALIIPSLVAICNESMFKLGFMVFGYHPDSKQRVLFVRGSVLILIIDHFKSAVERFKANPPQKNSRKENLPIRNPISSQNVGSANPLMHPNLTQNVNLTNSTQSVNSPGIFSIQFHVFKNDFSLDYWTYSFITNSNLYSLDPFIVELSQMGVIYYIEESRYFYIDSSTGEKVSLVIK